MFVAITVTAFVNLHIGQPISVRDLGHMFVRHRNLHIGQPISVRDLGHMFSPSAGCKHVFIDRVFAPQCCGHMTSYRLHRLH